MLHSYPYQEYDFLCGKHLQTQKSASLKPASVEKDLLSFPRLLQYEPESLRAGLSPLLIRGLDQLFFPTPKRANLTASRVIIPRPHKSPHLPDVQH